MKVEMKVEPIPNCNGYFAGEDGFIYSTRNFNRHHNTSGEMKKLKLHDNGTGYLGVTICINSKRRYRKVHRLVFEAFKGNCGEHIHHLDGDITNNKPENLTSMSVDEHMEHHCKDWSYTGRAISHLQSLGYQVIPPLG